MKLGENLIKQKYFIKRHDRKKTLDAFPLKLLWRKVGWPGLLPFTTVQYV